jgi:hypothetical protein
MAVPRAKPKQITLRAKDIERLKTQLSREITNKAMLITICAVRDELKLDDTKIFKCVERVDRYADHLGKHLVKINDFSKSLKDSTGIDWGLF